MQKKISYNSPVILTFFCFSLVSLILGNYTNGFTTRLLFSVYRSPINDPLAYIRIFCHVLGHVNFAHFFNNMLIILLVGPLLEEKYGSIILFYLIVATALITGLFHIIFFKGALLGASGIAFMFIVLTSFTNVKSDKIPITLILVSFMYIGNEIYLSIAQEDNVSRITHILGGLLGAFFGIILNRYNKGRKYD